MSEHKDVRNTNVQTIISETGFRPFGVFGQRCFGHFSFIHFGFGLLDFGHFTLAPKKTGEGHFCGNPSLEKFFSMQLPITVFGFLIIFACLKLAQEPISQTHAAVLCHIHSVILQAAGVYEMGPRIF
jgi:hypothetical protein